MKTDVANDNAHLTIAERGFLLIIVIVGAIEFGALAWLSGRLLVGLMGA